MFQRKASCLKQSWRDLKTAAKFHAFALCMFVYTGDEANVNTNAKFSHTSNGAGRHSYYPTLPQITPRSTHPDQDAQAPPVVTRTSPTPMSSARPPANQYGSQNKLDNIVSNHGTAAVREYSDSQTSDKNYSQRTNNMPTQQPNNSNNSHITKPPQDLRVSHPPSNSEPHLDPSQHHLASSPRRHQGSGQGDGGQEDYLRPLSATPPLVQNEKSKSVKAEPYGSNESQHKHDEDSGIAGLTPDTYRDNEDPLDR